MDRQNDRLSFAVHVYLNGNELVWQHTSEGLSVLAALQPP